MLKKGMTLTALVGLTACAIPPQGVSQEDLRAFDEAVASIGCSLITEADYLPVELQTGLTLEQLQQIAAYKLTAQQAVSLEGGGIQLNTGACA